MSPALEPAPERAAAVDRAWRQLTGPGATLNPSERHRIIELARAAWRGEEPRAGSPGDEAALATATDAEGISADFVDALAARGLDGLRYLETIGVVGRLSNIDWYARGIGAPLPDLPPASGGATGVVAPDARITDGWVPMTRNAMAPRVLDALPDEGDAHRDLHEPMYIPMDRIDDWTHGDVLSRVQIEFIAARTSYLNECFY